MKKILILFISLSILLVSGCQFKPKTFSEVERDPIQEIMDNMTIQEKVGQLFYIRPDALDFKKKAKSKGTKKLTEQMIKNYEEYPCGGFCIFGGNISSSKQLVSLNKSLHSLGNIKPFIFVDEEGGSIARIANSGKFKVKKFSNMEKIAKKEDYDLAFQLGDTIGGYLDKYGFDGDFAPVCDVNTNPKNKVIGSRAFGSNPKIAAKMISQVIDGLHHHDILTTIKHFPGHGDTLGDTHTGYAYTNKTWQEMLECEMIPFIQGIESGSELVMVAHIATPNITGNELPASLSYELVTEKLRNELGFTGVIVTDGMEMGAITEQFSSDQAAIKAILAGVDIILLPKDYRKAFDGVLKAIEDGEITMERIDESVYRLLSMKYSKK